ncbi:MAG TPA: AraC family transcriptional regulator [Capsulimonadaceae bacterium]|jgi:AraC-like DNA-binding protein
MDNIIIVANQCLNWINMSRPPQVYFAGATPILQYNNAPAPNLEVCYMEMGSVENLRVGDEVVDICEGAVSITNMHFGNWSPPKAERGRAWCIILDAASVPDELSYLSSRPVVAATVARNPADLRDVFRRLRRHCSRHSVSPVDYDPSVVMYAQKDTSCIDGGAWRLKGLLIELFGMLLESSETQGIGQPHVSELVQRVRDLLDEQFANPELTLDHLASVACLSRAQFGRRFAAEVGEPPMAYVLRLRLREASLLLRHTRQRVSDIALSVGFNDPLYFTKTFHRAYGASPRAFRDAES